MEDSASQEAKEALERRGRQECVIYTASLPAHFLKCAYIFKGRCYTEEVYAYLQQADKPEIAQVLSLSSSSVGKLAVRYRAVVGSATLQEFWAYGTAFCIARDTREEKTILQTAGHNIWDDFQDLTLYRAVEIYFCSYPNNVLEYPKTSDLYTKCEVIYCSPQGITAPNPITGVPKAGGADFAFLKVKLPRCRYNKKNPLFPIKPVEDIAVIAYASQKSPEYIFPQKLLSDAPAEAANFNMATSSEIFNNYHTQIASFGQLSHIGGNAASTACTTKGCSGGPVVPLDASLPRTFCGHHVGYNGVGASFEASNYNEVLTTLNEEYVDKYITHVLLPYIDRETIPDDVGKRIALVVSPVFKKRKAAAASTACSAVADPSAGSPSTTSSTVPEIQRYLESLCDVV
jgi:hypothetical protein